MDIRCPKCGEPWDFDSLHEETEYRTESSGGAAYEDAFRTVRRDFTRRGCAALTAYGARCAGGAAHPGIGVIYELMGDDIDGAASFLEDAEYLGMLS